VAGHEPPEGLASALVESAKHPPECRGLTRHPAAGHLLALIVAADAPLRAVLSRLRRQGDRTSDS